MTDQELAGKVALITGANHGIGAATARRLATLGAALVLHYFRAACAYSPAELTAAEAAGVGGDALYRARQQQSIAPLVAAVTSGGGRALVVESDLGDAPNIPQLFDAGEVSLGPVDIMVVNHTHCVPTTFAPALEAATGPGPVTAEGIDRHFAVNSRATALMIAEFARRHRARAADWGRIILVSTDAAHAHVANVSYAASKHAMESYGRSAAAELGRYGITVNLVAPGPIQTGYLTPAQEQAIAARTPLGRVGEPADVADVIGFLASARARWLTGQLLYVGGGWRMGQ